MKGNTNVIGTLPKTTLTKNKKSELITGKQHFNEFHYVTGYCVSIEEELRQTKNSRATDHVRIIIINLLNNIARVTYYESDK